MRESNLNYRWHFISKTCLHFYVGVNYAHHGTLEKLIEDDYDNLQVPLRLPPD